MDVREWFNVSTIGAPLWILVSFAFGLFVGRPVMSLQVELLWGVATIIVAFLVWFGGAKSQQRAREAKENERVVMTILDDIKQLLAKPDTTLEDVRKATTGIDDSLSKGPLALRATQAEIIKRWWK